MQDGYAVRAADGAGEYDVEFEQLAGSAPGSLSKGKVAYITTGAPSCTMALRLRLVIRINFPADAVSCHLVRCSMQVRHCQKELMLWCKWRTRRI